VRRVEQRQQLLQLLAVRPVRPAQGRGHVRRPARRAAIAEVDPAWVQRRERAELLGHHERRVVGQRHAARADAQA
jgi:hypothetical protein